MNRPLEPGQASPNHAGPPLPSAVPSSRPILFSAAMVRAILEDRKTQTRRVVGGLLSRQETGEDYDSLAKCCVTQEAALELRGGVLGFILTAEEIASRDWMEGETPLPGWVQMVEGKGPGGNGNPTRCPYGVPGDRLWVREAWKVASNFDDSSPKQLVDDLAVSRSEVRYLADPDTDLNGKDRRSIHLPRKFSRILLEITDVRVERVQDISESDALAEGLIKETVTVGRDRGFPDYDVFAARPGRHCEWEMSGKDAYARLWKSINGEGSWDSNPWVWVIEFRRILPAIGGAR